MAHHTGHHAAFEDSQFTVCSFSHIMVSCLFYIILLDGRWLEDGMAAFSAYFDLPRNVSYSTLHSPYA